MKNKDNINFYYRNSTVASETVKSLFAQRFLIFLIRESVSCVLERFQAWCRALFNFGMHHGELCRAESCFSSIPYTSFKGLRSDYIEACTGYLQFQGNRGWYPHGEDVHCYSWIWIQEQQYLETDESKAQGSYLCILQQLQTRIEDVEILCDCLTLCLLP